jgi:hypothetical protein
LVIEFIETITGEPYTLQKDIYVRLENNGKENKSSKSTFDLIPAQI